MRWDTLGYHGNPLTSYIVIPIFGEFELPQRCVNTHIHFLLLRDFSQCGVDDVLTNPLTTLTSSCSQAGHGRLRFNVGERHALCRRSLKMRHLQKLTDRHGRHEMQHQFA
jgi:hypothetical protein